MTNAEFNLIVREGKEPDLAKSFYNLAETTLDHFGSRVLAWDRDDLLQEGVMFCYEKLKRFAKSDSDKAFNYFTTILLGFYGQSVKI